MEYVLSLIKRNKVRGKDIFDINLSKPSDALKLAIYKQRYTNICAYVDTYLNQLSFHEKTILKDYYFFNNDLKEMNIIGTDFYMDTKFIKNKVPFLYRCVGKDGEYNYENKNYKISDHVKEIMIQSKEQIETGGKGQLFSYSKCFGKMLYKYASILNDNGKITIEIRNDALINTIQPKKESNSLFMIQEYIIKCDVESGEAPLPYFSIDMSTVRGNDVKNLKKWLDSYLGKKNSYDNVVDPIGDAEVVMNFTYLDNKNSASGVKRETLDMEDFCVLLYQYFKNYFVKVKKSSNLDEFDTFITKSLDTLPKYFSKDEINQILKKANNDVITNLLDKNVDWEKEKYYMTRRKEDKPSNQNIPKQMEIYKGKNANWKTQVLKDILFEVVKGKYSYINFGGNSNEK